MSKKNKIVYVGLSADILHAGHINILKTAKKYGDLVVVGLLTDKAIASYKNIPTLNYKQREIILKNIKFVKRVIPQQTLDYRPNLKKLNLILLFMGMIGKKVSKQKLELKLLMYFDLGVEN